MREFVTEMPPSIPFEGCRSDRSMSGAKTNLFVRLILFPFREETNWKPPFGAPSKRIFGKGDLKESIGQTFVSASIN
jgi:hypothetical protein